MYGGRYCEEPSAAAVPALQLPSSPAPQPSSPAVPTLHVCKADGATARGPALQGAQRCSSPSGAAGLAVQQSSSRHLFQCATHARHRMLLITSQWSNVQSSLSNYSDYLLVRSSQVIVRNSANPYIPSPL